VFVLLREKAVYTGAANNKPSNHAHQVIVKMTFY